MPLSPIYVGDSLSVQVTVADSATGAPLDLTAATVSASAEVSGAKYPGGVSLPDPAAGVAVIYWEPGAIPAGIALVQMRVILGANEQTVFSDTVYVNDSAF